jgi:hypothetical protein
LVQELQTINVQMRIITEDNIEQIANMSYSNNLDKLLKQKGTRPEHLIDAIKKTIAKKTMWKDEIKTPLSAYTPTPSIDIDSVPFIETSPAYVPSPETVDDYLALGTDKNNGSPVYNPVSPASDDEVFGGGNAETTVHLENTNPYMDSDTASHGFQVGDQVLRRGQTGGEARRPWTVSNVGDKFITIKAADNRGLREEDSTCVVGTPEVYPMSNLVHAQSQGQGQGHPYMQGAPQFFDNYAGQIPYDQVSPYPPQMPSIVVAPKFFNGNGNDQSTSTVPVSQEVYPSNGVSTGQPTIMLNGGGPNVSTVQESQGGGVSNNANQKGDGNIDFSKALIIKKQG